MVPRKRFKVKNQPNLGLNKLISETFSPAKDCPSTDEFFTTADLHHAFHHEFYNHEIDVAMKELGFKREFISGRYYWLVKIK